MNVIRFGRKVLQVLKEDGLGRVANLTLASLPIPQAHSFKWKAGIKSEVIFWNKYLRTSGLHWPETFRFRTDPDAMLQSRPAELLPDHEAVQILDVGAGPFTYLGKKCEGREIKITAVDPLADEYDELLEKHNVEPPVRTIKVDGERLTETFEVDTFDLVFARNCIDHSYNPEQAILEMISVCKPDCYVLLEHRPNEAENERYVGLHQW
ncbi:MAG: methyltransferase domain-containing protein, partial [Bacteroidota bacterium]